MTSRISTYLFLVALISGMLSYTQPVAQDDEISLTMDLNRTKIAIGETALLSIAVSSDKQVGLSEPKLPPLPSFDVHPSGNSSSLQIINGAVSYSMTFNYILSPKKEGTFPIRKASLVYGGRRYESNELKIDVVKTSAQAGAPAEDVVRDDDGTLRNLFVTAETDIKKAYVAQQVKLVVKFYRAVDASSPEIFMPQTPGFWTYDVSQPRQYYQDLKGRTYIVREERKILFPTSPGDLTIGETQVRTAIPTGRQNRDPFSMFGDLFQERQYVTLKAPPFNIEVLPLPDAGKPADFSGAVGRYDISAQIDKRNVQVNEAISLSVRISGQGNIKSLPEPQLPDLPDFRVETSSSDYDAGLQGDDVGGSKVYEYVLIPRVAGEKKIGSIELSYFDPRTKSYKTAKTAPIDINVSQGEAVANEEVPYNIVSGQTVALQETGIRYIKPEIKSSQRQGYLTLTSTVFLVFMAIPSLALLGCVGNVVRRRRLQSDVGYARLRKARSMAKKRLNRAADMMSHENGGDFYAEISGVVLKYVADKLNLSAHGLTTDRIEDLLKDRGIEDQLLAQTREIIGKADFGRFAGPTGNQSDRQELYKKTSRLIVDLEGKL